MIAACTKRLHACRVSVTFRGVLAYPGIRDGRRIDQQKRASTLAIACRRRPDRRVNIRTEIIWRDAKKVEQIGFFEGEQSLLIRLAAQVVEGRQGLTVHTLARCEHTG